LAALERRAGGQVGTLLGVGPDGSARQAGGALFRTEQPFAEAAIARLYDAFSFEDDLPLYLELAREQGGKVLEVACGSGRVLLPLVRAGFELVGVDSSPHMLAITREKLDAEAASSNRGQLIQADMRNFTLERGDFDLAIVAVKSFAYLTERHEQLRCLQSIYAHLRPGGLLAMDLLHPRLDWLAMPRGLLRDDLVQTVANGGDTVSRVESVVSTDFARQTRVIRSTYEVINGEGAVVEKRFVEWLYRWTYRYEAEHLLEQAGFEVEALYGGYQREPFQSESAVMLFLARKTR
jgi:SAM-dependent methyltransferase